MIGLIVLSLALSVDAFAVALARGASGEHRFARALETGLAFGVAQALMPLAGWFLGSAVLASFAAYDTWIAGGVLALIGLHMVFEAGRAGDAAGPQGRNGHYWALLLAALATSIDAAAAGLSLDVFDVPIWLACLIIGLVTASLCVAGYWLASRLSDRLGNRAQYFGGLVLIGLGLLIAFEMGI